MSERLIDYCSSFNINLIEEFILIEKANKYDYYCHVEEVGIVRYRLKCSMYSYEVSSSVANTFEPSESDFFEFDNFNAIRFPDLMKEIQEFMEALESQFAKRRHVQRCGTVEEFREYLNATEGVDEEE